jgi:hypothetical protein
MRHFVIHLAVLLLLGSGRVAQCEPGAERIQTLKAEIARLETACVPAKGTARSDVEATFGTGRPGENSKVMPNNGIPADSPYRVYDFCFNGTLVVRYDQHWRVMHANYFNPYQTKGRPVQSSVTSEEELREVEPRLRQMQQINAEYAARLGHK